MAGFYRWVGAGRPTLHPEVEFRGISTIQINKHLQLRSDVVQIWRLVHKHLGYEGIANCRGELCMLLAYTHACITNE
jgi:hypothetical protein